MRRLLARLGLAALLAGGGLAVASPAQAAACTGSSGVTVVVQSGGSADVRCASGDPGSAGAALQSAGFSVAQVQTQPGAICTIGGVPSTSCVRMPPKDQYWAFHHASAGGSWSYASRGAFAYDPKPGTVVGFRLGSGAAPGITPPKVSQPSPTQKPTATQEPRPTSAPRPPSSAPDRPSSSAPRGTTAPQRSDAGSSDPGSQAPVAPSATPSAKGGSPASSSAASATSAQEKAEGEKKTSSPEDKKKDQDREDGKKATSSSTSAATDDDDATAAPEDTGSDGGGVGSSMVPAAIGGGLLVVLGSSAFAVARMRRD